ncbi:MAG: TonB-dependent receptor [Chitinophagales bacterium]|nr:TonB-dependent receptor [Chitinophagales bacterium]
MIAKSKKHITNLLIFIFISHFTYGQTGSIMGRIIDSQTKEELIGASVVLDNSSFSTVSDIDGFFIISNVHAGTYVLNSSYISYEPVTIQNITILKEDTIYLNIELNTTTIHLEDVTIAAKKNRELENILLIDQKKTLMVTKSIGSTELSRKGIGDAESAVASIAGISKQEGIKNVFVRGLGDRYNATFLNGLPIPSEDPEYKNISLSFFETDIIKNIDVEKVFSATYLNDIGGAVVNINSKELTSDKAFGISISSGIHSRISGNSFLQPDGMNYLGFANNKKPTYGQFDFSNSLDPQRLTLPLNEHFRIFGGKDIDIKNNPLSFYVVASHASEYSITDELIRNITTDGTIYQDQEGKKYSGKKSQLALANLNYNLNQSLYIAYNFLIIHATQYYTGEYYGKHAEKFQDGIQDQGFLRRQQINDNLLLTHQLLSKWKIARNWNLRADFSVNQIMGNEPDRRENYLTQRADGTFGLTGSNRQKRFFSQLSENNYNANVTADYLLGRSNYETPSKISIGLKTYMSNLFFKAEEFNFSAVSGTLSSKELQLDHLYNEANFHLNKFSISQGYPSSYSVSKNNHSAFILGSFQITSSLSSMVAGQLDWINMNVVYDVPGQKGKNNMNTPFFLPNIHLKYEINDNQNLRFGASKTYTLPQSKEISPFQYVNIGYTSEGNPNLLHSENYNYDIKWDNHLSHSEILSLSLFYKKIKNPIGRVDKGNSAGLLTYDNISKEANILGFETELRKNIFHNPNLTLGMNFSYIWTNAKLNIGNTPIRNSGLEGASPIIVNCDLTYRLKSDNHDLTTAIIYNYFSDRIFTIGTIDYADIIEKGAHVVDFVIRGNISQRIKWNMKAGNILDTKFLLSRKVQNTNEVLTLHQYRKGTHLSFGVSFEL